MFKWQMNVLSTEELYLPSANALSSKDWKNYTAFMTFWLTLFPGLKVFCRTPQTFFDAARPSCPEFAQPNADKIH